MIISVVIPVKNGAETLGRCLESIRNQDIAQQYELEIIVLDSGSTDESVEIAKQYGVAVVPIEPQTFNHGETRNYGVSLAKGELVYFTVQDAWQQESSTLGRMVKHFEDPLVMGVCGDQGTPKSKNCNPARWFNPVNTPTVDRFHFSSPDDFYALSPNEQVQITRWDNVNAMYRKQALLAYPFMKVEFAEDMGWKKTALVNGLTVVRDSSAVVYHYHYADFNYSFSLNFTVLYHFYKMFGAIPDYPPLFRNILHTLYRLWKNRGISLYEKGSWALHNIEGSWGEWLAAYRLRKLIRKKANLEEAYKFYCKTVPQGRLKNQLEN